MKITKEMLAKARRRIAAEHAINAVGASSALGVCIGADELQALLDERSAMLAAVKDIVTAFRARAVMWPSNPQAPAYFAAARDLEEHPAFCGIEKE